MIKIHLKPSKVNFKLLSTFFEMNENGEWTFSEKKQKKFLKKLIKKN